jgi:hypothetical protein
MLVNVLYLHCSVSITNLPVHCLHDSFQTDYWICGIAPFGDYLVMLAYVDATDSDNEDERDTSSGRVCGAATR